MEYDGVDRVYKLYFCHGAHTREDINSHDNI